MVTLSYHEEDSYLMRFANSAISLNTNEHLIRLDITAYEGKKRASYNLITNLDKVAEMKQGIDTAAELVVHSQPLQYEPTMPEFKETFIDERGYDHALAKISNEERLATFNEAVAGLETEDIRLSGIFSNGTNIIAQANTLSDHAQYFKTSDAQVTAVLAHAVDKWEASAEASAQQKSDLDASAVREELAFLVDKYLHNKAVQLPLGEYDIIFGPAAVAEMVSFMNWIAFDGGLEKRGFSFLNESKIGERVFSEHFTLHDDPTRLETFPFGKDLTGIERQRYPIIESGVFNGFLWNQDDADEFGAAPTGHTVPHKSLVVSPGDKAVGSLSELVEMPLQRDLLYIPFLHYMNIVNPSKGIITGSSRFGALLITQDGEVQTPYNVRLTQSLLDIFGEKVDWISAETVAYNTSMSYGARNPTALVVPRFMCTRGLEISHSNDSF
jgi:predicted Zn-dependent protease